MSLKRITDSLENQIVCESVENLSSINIRKTLKRTRHSNWRVLLKYYQRKEEVAFKYVKRFDNEYGPLVETMSDTKSADFDEAMKRCVEDFVKSFTHDDEHSQWLRERAQTTLLRLREIQKTAETRGEILEEIQRLRDIQNHNYVEIATKALKLLRLTEALYDAGRWFRFHRKKRVARGVLIVNPSLGIITAEPNGKIHLTASECYQASGRIFWIDGTDFTAE